jgi:hypothetical protein
MAGTTIGFVRRHHQNGEVRVDLATDGAIDPYAKSHNGNITAMYSHTTVVLRRRRKPAAGGMFATRRAFAAIDCKPKAEALAFLRNQIGSFNGARKNVMYAGPMAKPNVSLI